MADFILNLPLWLIKTLAVVLGLGLAVVFAFVISRLFNKVYQRHREGD